MKPAATFLLSSVAVFVLMLVLHDRSEGASMVLFPVGVLFAFASLVTGVTGAVRGRGATRAGSTAVIVTSLFVLSLAAAALLWFLWVMGVFGNAWG